MLCYTLHNRFERPLYSLILLCISLGVFSQADTATHGLNEVVILAPKQELFQAGKKLQNYDSTTLALYQSSSLADLLTSQSSMHIKSYGNGNMATMSFRGGNANQTAVVWNGINIQNNMLGQNDLSLVNTMLFDNVALEFGGSSALWGSGAISGAVLLGNKPKFGKGVSTKIASSYGTYNTLKLNTGIDLSYSKWASSTKVYFIGSDNNYAYKDTSDKIQPDKKITHADYTCYGLMQELSFLAGSHHKLSVRAWLNDMFRNLPSYTSSISKQSQVDRNLKLNAEWNYSKRLYNSTVRLAYLNDVLNYTDSLINLFSKSRSYTWVAENEHTLRYRSHVVQLGLNYTMYGAETQSYNGAQHYHKLGLFASYRWTGFHDKLNTTLNLRQEFSQQYQVPLTGNAGLSYVLIKNISLKLNAAKSFRQPTLNDLYWNPGGNPDLKPEEAYGYEGGVVFDKTIKKIQLFFEGTYFNRHTTNWIIWLPQSNGVWSPRNIAEVHSRGTETNFHVRYKATDFSLKLFGSTAYVLSTNERSLNENDNSLGRQLIYTPRYTVQGGLMFTLLEDLALMYTHSYTGYRFTSTDNTSWLNPYMLGNLKASYTLGFNTIRVQAFFSVNNIFNANYQVVTNRPMPLRNYEAGISLMYNKSKQHKS